MSNERRDTGAWIFQCWASFILAFGTTMVGIYHLPVGTWEKGFMVIGFLFTVGSCFTLAKTIRDAHEDERWRNRIKEAKAEKFVREFEAAI